MQQFTNENRILFNTSILFLVFNRLDSTKMVFAKIRSIKPPRLYIASDGPRDFNEKGKVLEIRKYLIDNIDWKCEVKTLFSDKNKGCKNAVSSSISWFFNNEESGIILEDDCLPNTSFFIYCQELLDRYKNDDKVFMISGDGITSSKVGIANDYCFTKYPMIWGWASWSRVWKKYDVNMTTWKDENLNFLDKVITKNDTKLFWIDIFNKIYNKEIDTWDYQMVYLLLKNNAYCIIPKFNLISNIGFGENATHTSDKWSEKSNYITQEFNFPLNHQLVQQDQIMVDKYFEKYEFGHKSFFIRTKFKIKKLLKKYL